MNLTDQLIPTPLQMQALHAMPQSEPIVMINIIKFRDKTENGTETGWEAYARYTQRVMPMLEEAGGRLLWQGTVREVVVGSSDLPPDTIFLVEYPSVASFLEMINSEAYLKISKDRRIGLTFGGLYASSTDYSILK